MLKRQDGTYGMLITKETIKDVDDQETIEEDQCLYLRTKGEYVDLFEDSGFHVVYVAQEPLDYGEDYFKCLTFGLYPKDSVAPMLFHMPRGFGNMLDENKKPFIPTLA